MFVFNSYLRLLYCFLVFLALFRIVARPQEEPVGSANDTKLDPGPG